MIKDLKQLENQEEIRNLAININYYRIVMKNAVANIFLNRTIVCIRQDILEVKKFWIDSILKCKKWKI